MHAGVPLAQELHALEAGLQNPQDNQQQDDSPQEDGAVEHGLFLHRLGQRNHLDLIGKRGGCVALVRRGDGKGGLSGGLGREGGLVQRPAFRERVAGRFRFLRHFDAHRVLRAGQPDAQRVMGKVFVVKQVVERNRPWLRRLLLEQGEGLHLRAGSQQPAGRLLPDRWRRVPAGNVVKLRAAQLDAAALVSLVPRPKLRPDDVLLAVVQLQGARPGRAVGLRQPKFDVRPAHAVPLDVEGADVWVVAGDVVAGSGALDPDAEVHDGILVEIALVVGLGDQADDRRIRLFQFAGDGDHLDRDFQPIRGQRRARRVCQRSAVVVLHLDKQRRRARLALRGDGRRHPGVFPGVCDEHNPGVAAQDGWRQGVPVPVYHIVGEAQRPFLRLAVLRVVGVVDFHPDGRDAGQGDLGCLVFHREADGIGHPEQAGAGEPHEQLVLAFLPDGVMVDVQEVADAERRFKAVPPGRVGRQLDLGDGGLGVQRRAAVIARHQVRPRLDALDDLAVRVPLLLVQERVPGRLPVLPQLRRQGDAVPLFIRPRGRLKLHRKGFRIVVQNVDRNVLRRVFHLAEHQPPRPPLAGLVDFVLDKAAHLDLVYVGDGDPVVVPRHHEPDVLQPLGLQEDVGFFNGFVGDVDFNLVIALVRLVRRDRLGAHHLGADLVAEHRAEDLGQVRRLVDFQAEAARGVGPVEHVGFDLGVHVLVVRPAVEQHGVDGVSVLPAVGRRLVGLVQFAPLDVRHVLFVGSARRGNPPVRQQQDHGLVAVAARAVPVGRAGVEQTHRFLKGGADHGAALRAVVRRMDKIGQLAGEHRPVA